MAKYATFLCECRKEISRPYNSNPDEGAPRYAVVPWHARPGDAVIRGIRCGDCGQWWDFVKPTKFKKFVDVRPSCLPDQCTTMAHLNGECQ